MSVDTIHKSFVIFVTFVIFVAVVWPRYRKNTAAAVVRKYKIPT
jgi:hypothetical protein